MRGPQGYLSRGADRPSHSDRRDGHAAGCVHGVVHPRAQRLTLHHRAGESKPFIRNVFTLNSCAHIVGSQVLEFKDERKLLSSWRDFVNTVDPDVIIGYNISNFDLPYLLDRAKALKVGDFPYLGRLKGGLFQLLRP